MLCYRQHKKFEGEQWLLYLGGYGLGRAWIEGIRTDTLFIPHTTIAVSQVLAIVLFCFAVVTDVVVRIRMKKVNPSHVAIYEGEENLKKILKKNPCIKCTDFLNINHFFAI